MKFIFRLQAVLTIRQHERQIQQQSLAIARRIYHDRVVDRRRIAEERSAIMDELRSMNNSENSFSTERMIERQRYADQLSQSLTKADADIEDAAGQISFCLKHLMFIDQAVRSLEKLAARQRAEFESMQTASLDRELEDITQFRL